MDAPSSSWVVGSEHSPDKSLMKDNSCTSSSSSGRSSWDITLDHDLDDLPYLDKHVILSVTLSLLVIYLPAEFFIVLSSERWGYGARRGYTLGRKVDFLHKSPYDT